MTGRYAEPGGTLLVAADIAWQDDAACRTAETDAFFPHGHAAAQIDAAKAVCAECPVAAECLDYALVNRIDHGVWGGLAEDERYGMRPKLRKVSRIRRSEMILAHLATVDSATAAEAAAATDTTSGNASALLQRLARSGQVTFFDEVERRYPGGVRRRYRLASEQPAVLAG